MKVGPQCSRVERQCFKRCVFSGKINITKQEHKTTQTTN